MTADSASTERIDYLQRSGVAPELGAIASTSGSVASRRMLRVNGIGRPDKRDPALRTLRPDERWRPPTAELITGLYGYRIPLTFQVIGSPLGVELYLGTWSARDASDQAQDRRIAVTESVMRGLYPVVDVQQAAPSTSGWPLGGLALGVPAPYGIDQTDGASPIDRIIRSMAGATWSAIVLAYPASEAALSEVRSSILNEMRAVAAAAENERAPSPLTEQYLDLLKAALESAGDGMATGAWRAGVYLLGDADSYPGLASAWRSVMSGKQSLPEPVRVFDQPEVDALAADWALPDRWGEPGPGHYQRPFECQTLLSTSELAAIVHLPELEASGFRVDQVARFDVVASAENAAGDRLELGAVLHNRRTTGTRYGVSMRSLTRHVLVAGTTGSGKTNTIMSLLDACASSDLPFMVIEPTKSEYRALIAHPRLGPELAVSTVGKSTVAPFTLNPFEVPPGTTVSEHLDLLRAAFTAAFGMWTPLPQILERCLHEVYVDRGWDLRSDLNLRLAGDADRSDAFPVLSDVIAKVSEVIPSLGYEDRVAGDLRAALVTRLESLTHGAKGAMLDVSRSISDGELFGRPTVGELEALGDGGDKALLTGLLLIRLAEFRRSRGQSPELVHLLVIEEAHRLLGNVPIHGSEEVANPRGQAVETFSNLLSEIRAYGQGVVIADQVPVRLAPDVIKNTNLKIAHRIVSTDDRLALAGAMAMDERQAGALTSLGVGEAAVFSGGDDAPLLVRFALTKDPLAPVPPDDDEVRAHLERRLGGEAIRELSQARPFCRQTCASPPACTAGRALAADEYVQRALSRMVVSALAQPGALDRLWDDLVGVLRARRPLTIDEPGLMRSFAGHGADWLASRRGTQGSWSYADTSEFRDRLQRVLLDKLGGADGGSDQAWAGLREITTRLHRREFEPYPACAIVCSEPTQLCMYRSAVADLVSSRRYNDAWYEADAADAGAEDQRRGQSWEVCQDAAYELIEFPDDEQPDDARAALDNSARQVALCFEQQMLAADRRKVPRTSRRVLSRVLREAGL